MLTILRHLHNLVANNLQLHGHQCAARLAVRPKSPHAEALGANGNIRCRRRIEGRRCPVHDLLDRPPHSRRARACAPGRCAVAALALSAGSIFRSRGRQGRRIRRHLSRATHHADAGRAPPGRGHEPHRPAVGHGNAARRHPARSLGAGSAVARLAARHLSERARAESHARRHRAVRHSPAAAADRDGDRPQARANGRQGGAEHLGHRCRRAVHLRLRARPVHAGIAAAASRPASAHLAVPRHRLVDFLDQDRGGGRARNGLHPAQSRTDHRRFGDLRRLRSAGSSSPSSSASLKRARSTS